MARVSRSRPIMLLIVSGLAFIFAIAAATAMLVSNMRERAFADGQRELRNTALILAEQSDRAFQALELVQNSLIERMQSMGIASREDLERRMSGHDIHLMLKDKISGLPHVDAITLIDADGRLINFSRYWPIPPVNVADRDYFKALKSNPQLTSFMSKPVHNRGTGTWTIYLARKLVDANGEFMGLTLGAMELQYFEKFFGSIALGEGSSIALFRSDGLLLVRYPRIEAAVGQTFTGVVDALKQGDGGAIRLVSRMDNKDRVLAVRQLARYPVIVSVAMDVATILANWREDAKILIAAASLAALLIAAIGLLIVRQLLQGRKEHRRRLDTALNNMSQGLCMFGADSRLVLCNQRFLQMYGLSPVVVRRGCTLRALIRHRKETGSFPGDPDQYCAEILATVAQGNPACRIVENCDGQMVLVSHQPIAGGGWVVTHEDITERYRAEQEAQQAHARLREVIDVMPAGLVFYDKQNRLVLWNRRYDELYPETADLRVAGVRFEDMLRAGLARGVYADAAGREEEWLADRLALHSHPRKVHEQRLSNGRWLRVEDCKTADGGFIGIRVDITELKQREDDLKIQNMRFNAALQHMSPGLAMLDKDCKLIVCNDKYARMYGLPPELAQPGTTVRQILEHWLSAGVFTGPVAEQFIQERIVGAANGQPCDAILELDDGRVIAVANRRTNDGGWVSTHDDITERRRAEQERDRNQKFLDLIIENVPVTINVKDARERRYVLVNRAGEKFWGMSRAELVGKTSQEVLPKPYADVLAAQDTRLLQSDEDLFIDEHTIELPCNGPRIITAKRLVIRDDDSKPLYLVSVIEDVTERRRADERIAHLANYDALTDLPNRVLFREHLTEALKWTRRGEYVAVLYLDLDYFKNVNDSLGHPIGDELLKALSDRLRRCIRETDTVARLGGDEFAIIQTAVGRLADTNALVNRIFESIRAPYDLGGHQLVADASIGIAIAPDDGIEPDQLLKNADLALYSAKADGRGTYRFFEADMDARMKARRVLEADLRKALAGGEFELHYQPILNLANNEVCGCEALLRWRHPERGMILPAEFIPLAEETGLIIPIGEWVVKEACAEAATWPKNIKLAVNLSPAQFKSAALSLRIVDAFAASGLSPHRLELEITESVLMQNNQSVLATMHELCGLGVRFALDDFGTGYASLSYLRSFPFDKIKIDRCFVEDLADRQASLSIVRAVTSLANSLNMATTAEGVETADQLELVRAAGCTKMQGYYFSPPLPAAEIVRLFSSGADQAASAA